MSKSYFNETGTVGIGSTAEESLLDSQHLQPRVMSYYCTRIILLSLLVLKTLANESKREECEDCKFINVEELRHGLHSEFSFPNCRELNEKCNLFFFPDEVNNAGNISVCYYGTDTTSLMDVSRLQAYFIVYQERHHNLNNIALAQLTQPIQGIQPPVLQNSRICKQISLDSNEATRYFGVFVPKECFTDNTICPLQLEFLNQSKDQYDYDYDYNYTRRLEDILCEDLEIEIEIPETTTHNGPDVSSICSTFSSCSLKCPQQENGGISDKLWTVISFGIFLVILSILVLNSVFIGVWCRKKQKYKQAICTEKGLGAPHTNDNLAEPLKLNNCSGTGPSTSFHDPGHVVALSIDAHDYEELYFEPASKEEELVEQIKKLGVAEISRQSEGLRLFEVLGSGAFGTVHRGVWFHLGSSSEKLVEHEVAVKSMDGMACEEERVKFLQEAAIMAQFNHPNIIMMLGIVPDPPVGFKVFVVDAGKQMMILIEIMKTGDLRNHILDIKTKSINSPVSQELPPTLLSYSRQVASGMVYLSLKEFVHRDLAARNILVSDNGTCKIADFGLSRDLQDATYYKSHGGKIPVKWSAPEALYYHKYSTASDVWSYGCLLYEIWSLGYKPFHEDSNAEAIRKVSTGFRLPPPPGCPRALYDIMILCWHPEATRRPSFFDVTVLLQKPDFTLLQWSSEEINISSEEARTLGARLEAGHQLHMDLQKTYVVGAEQETNWQQDRESAEQIHNQDEDKEIDTAGLCKVLESNYEFDESYAENDIGEDGSVRVS